MSALNWLGLEIGPWSEWASAFASLASVVLVGVFTWKIAGDGLRAQRDLALETITKQRAARKVSVIRAFIAEIEGLVRLFDEYQWIESLLPIEAGTRVFFPGYDPRPGRRPALKVYDTLAGELGDLPGGATWQIVNFYMLANPALDLIDNPPPFDRGAGIDYWASASIRQINHVRFAATNLLPSLRQFVVELGM